MSIALGSAQFQPKSTNFTIKEKNMDTGTDYEANKTYVSKV